MGLIIKPSAATKAPEAPCLQKGALANKIEIHQWIDGYILKQSKWLKP